MTHFYSSYVKGMYPDPTIFLVATKYSLFRSLFSIYSTSVVHTLYKRFVSILQKALSINYYIMSNELSSSEDDDSDAINHDYSQLSWMPRDILRRTNWLYRVDALRIHDLREMHNLWEICNLFEKYATLFVAWAYSIKAIMSSSTDNIVISKLNNIFTIVTKLIEMFWSEGYCYFLDFLRIAYYPVTNRFTRNDQGPRFREKKRMTISEISVNE